MFKNSILAILFITFSICAEDYQFRGRHYFASYIDCDPEAIGDSKHLLEAMEAAVKASGATLLSKTSHLFLPGGLTAIYLLSESHASIHTYPEKNACFIDLFTCGDKCSPVNFDKELREYLKPKQVSARLFLRDEGIELLSTKAPPNF